MDEGEAIRLLDMALIELENAKKAFYLAKTFYKSVVDDIKKQRESLGFYPMPFVIEDKLSEIYVKAVLNFDEYKTFVVRMMESMVNAELGRVVASCLTTDGRPDDERSYEKKKEVVQLVNDYLRLVDAAISHPDTNKPCMLLAVGSPDGYGRYVLEDRSTKKRSQTSRTLMNLMPLRLMPDIPRKEGVIERRKARKKGDD